MSAAASVRLRHALASALGLVLFGVALAILFDELREYDRHEIIADVARLPPARVSLALVLTAANYVALTAYDALGLRLVGSRLPYRRVAVASFVSYVLSHNVGAAFVGGSAARFHLYSRWGLSATDIGRVIALNVVTFWLGFLALLGVVLLAEPLAPALGTAAGRLAGAACLVGVSAYLVLAAMRTRPIRVGRWTVPTPSLGLAVGQLAVSTVDWLLAAGVLLALVPLGADVSMPRFLGTFLVGQVAGAASHVPAGLGVFEAVVLRLLAPPLAPAALLGSLLVYRVVYYLLPLLVAAGTLGAMELAQRRAGVRRLARAAGRSVTAVLPDAFAATTFLGGIVLLASGAIPAADAGGWLGDLLPLPVLELSHFLGSVVGATMLLLARGLQRRLDGAWVLAVATFAAGAILSLLHGPHWAQAATLGLMLAALLPARRRFYRRASLLDEALSAEWIVGVLLVLVGVSWLLLFSYKHVEYSHDLWWQFELSEEAPRSLRATVGAFLVLLVYGLARVLRGARPAGRPPTADELATVRAVVAHAPETTAQLALLGDKRFLFSPARSAFVMYAVAGRSWVALRDPVGAPGEIRELAWRFHELADRHGGWTVFYEVGPQNLPLYLDLGLGVVKLGEEGYVPLEHFALEGRARKPLRRAHQRVAREGFGFEVVAADAVEPLLPQLKMVSDAWLAQKHTREKGFSLGFFAADYLRHFPAALVRREGRVYAFANVLLGAGKVELSIDLMRYDPAAPPGMMDFLLTELLLWGKAAGYRRFNLGMAPLSGFEDRALAPLWSRLGAFVFRHGEHFYNLQGLRQYKEKFDPTWEPRYLASPGGLALPRVLANVAALISGGLAGVVSR